MTMREGKIYEECIGGVQDTYSKELRGIYLQGERNYGGHKEYYEEVRVVKGAYNFQLLIFMGEKDHSWFSFSFI